MTLALEQIEVVLEVGKIRTFAIVPNWPGWCRSGRNENLALQALIDYGPRYARVLIDTQLGFCAPVEPSALHVVERLPGNATTDFGAPNIALPSDMLPLETAELQRLQTLLKACWKSFDNRVQLAEGKTLRKGPRGGGRDLMKIIEHVHNAEIACLNSLGGKITPNAKGAVGDTFSATRLAILTTMNLAARDQVPAPGSRGGKRWTARYVVRRLAWHELDHLWEIEERSE